MSIDTVVIIIFGLSATVFMLTFAWWLWTRAPMPAPPQSHHAGPPLGPPPDSPQWMAWSDPSAARAPPSPERVEFESSTLEPVGELMRDGDGDGDMDKARTMFFMKKPADSTQILSDDLEFLIPQAEDEAPLHYEEQTQTAPRPQATAKRRRPPPPPPPRH